MLRIFFIFIIFFTSPILANTFSIDMLNVRSDGQSMVYSEDVLKVEVGDTVVWKPKDKGHNVEFIIGPDAIELPKKSRINQEFTYTFEKSGVYFYQCTPHKSMGMIAVIIVGDDLTNLDQVKSVRVFGKSKRKLEEILSLI
ncbi:MAG: plastocyanin/azurin family copper-binding protein [Hyphomicrobiales bacterium]|jgi:pseudoazurin|nr:plastocyanin/azurin family copper-binding protein [Hyphomicrobiales bacterium]